MTPSDGIRPATLGRGEWRGLADIGGIISAVPDAEEAAHEVLEAFRRIVPYAAASLQAWNPILGRHETIANVGYPPHAVRHLDTWFVESDEAYLFMRRVDSRPVRWRDMPFDYRRLRSATEFWMPLGFDEGVTTCLYDGHGRYTGNLHLNTDSRKHPTDAAMPALAVLQYLLAGLVNPLRTPAAIARAVNPAANAAIITQTGTAISLPGCSLGPHLVEGATLVTLASHLTDAYTSGSRFLWRDPLGEWHKVRFEAVAHGVLVTESPTELPDSLTTRELEILTLVAAGHSNPEIAGMLIIAVKTVAKHVEHLLQKLGCTSRTALATRALRDGLRRL
jgi:DNA-binding CsgD family transcriptional regulator